MVWKAYNAILDDARTLILDARPLRAYLERHIRGSINVKLSSSGSTLKWVAGPGPPTWSQDCWWGRRVLVVSPKYASEKHMRRDLQLDSGGVRRRKKSRSSRHGRGDADEVLEFLFTEARTKSLRIVESEDGDEKDAFSAFAKQYPFLVTRSQKAAVVSGYPAEVVPRLLYLGDLEHARAEKHLDDLHVTHVLTIHTEPLKLSSGFVQMFCELADESKADITQYFERTFQFVEDARKAKNRVLVHCGAGASRSATLCASYLMRVNQWRADYTLKFLKEQRRQVDPNPGFTTALINFERSLGLLNKEDSPSHPIEENLGAHDGDGQTNETKRVRVDATSQQLVFDILKEGTVLGTLELSDTRVLVCGRGATCDVILDHASISRQHAKLEYTKILGVTVMDLNSIHGTFVNNVRLVPTTKQQLHVGDVLTFGASTRRYVLRWSTAGEANKSGEATPLIGSLSLGRQSLLGSFWWWEDDCAASRFESSSPRRVAD